MGGCLWPSPCFYLIKIRCLLLLPLIVPKLKLITGKSELKKKKIVISFGEFEAEGHSRVSAGPEGTGLCSEQTWLLTCVCERVCAPPEVSVRGPFGTCF